LKLYQFLLLQRGSWFSGAKAAFCVYKARLLKRGAL
jgi:hypothetical protein